MTSADAPPYALIASGQGALLAQRMRERVAATPGDCAARYLLFAALAACGQEDEAAAALDEARQLHSLMAIRQGGSDLERLRRDAQYAVTVAMQLYAAGHVAMASMASGAAIASGANDPSTLLTHALALQHQGRAAEAVEAFREAGRRFPAPIVTQFVLPALFAVDDGVEHHSREARAWAAQYAPPRPAPPFANSLSPDRPIRVGYVNPSFTQNQARNFIAPLFDRHDPKRVAVFAYANQAEQPAWDAPVQMRNIGDLDDAAAAELIRGDRIDVLVDCWGHNSGNRLTMFALCPAPIMASWLNYQQTTGLAAMDYVIQADVADGEELRGLFVEDVWLMGDACAAFRPDPGPRGSPAPCLATGRTTFGAFINPAKLTDLTVAMWAEILRGQPTSRLILKYRYFTDPVLQMVTQARFLARGANPAQVEFRGRTNGAAYHAEFAEIDLALDPSPCPGGTTSLEALSRGVPVLTLKGETFYARLGAGVVAPAGLPDMVADSPAAYVAKALELSEHPQRLQMLRERVGPGFDAAPYRDEAAMARRLEDVYRAMFRRWCERGQAAA